MPRKLGQHFLRHSPSLKKITSALEIKNGDFIFEIGPGHGELSDFLISAGAETSFFLLEKDKKLVSFLKNKYADSKNIEIIEGDALKTLPLLVEKHQLKINVGDYKIAGNIPYYLTGRLFRIISGLHPLPKLVVFTIQKEVAERICSKKGDFNLLSASILFFWDPQVILRLKRGDFNPPPEVDSAVILLKKSNTPPIISESTYFSFIRAAFKQPRKTLTNNLFSGLKIPKATTEKALADLNLSALSRPEDLDFPLLQKLIKLFS